MNVEQIQTIGSSKETYNSIHSSWRQRLCRNISHQSFHRSEV